MPLLTSENLDINYGYRFDWKDLSRGRQYYQENRAVVIEFTGDTAVCQVKGSNLYIVTIQAKNRREVLTQCTCPQAAKARSCKHIVAALLAVNQYIVAIAQHHWEYRLSAAMEQLPKRKPGLPRQNAYVLVFLLQREQVYGNQSRFNLLVRRFEAGDWNLIKDNYSPEPGELFNQALDQDRSWVRALQPINGFQHPYDCLNLPAEAVEAVNLLNRSVNYYGQSAFADYLAILASHYPPIFSGKDGVPRRQIHLRREPVTIQAAVTRSGDEISIQTGASLDGAIYTTAKNTLEVITRQPDWVLAGDHLAPVANPEALDLMAYFPLTIPASEEENFRRRFFGPLAQRIEMVGEMITYEDITLQPTPRLYLTESEGVLNGALTFGYGDYEVDANPKAAEVSIIDTPGSWKMTRVHRDLAIESEFYTLLTEPKYGLKRAGRELGPAAFSLRARTHPFDFLMHSIPLMVKAGFEIFGEESLRSAKINRNPPRVTLTIASGIDWFELQAVVEYGDQAISLKEVRKAIRNGDRYVKLADGSVGQIPDDWLERYRHLFNLAEETGTGYRVSDFHLSLLDELVAEAGDIQIPPDLPERIARLRNFERITPVPVPQGFTGELRPYQKAGLDWLHFLYDYGFGGLLADDMGLGKTIQALAFIQSLKEYGKSRSACLLVVPKSLLTNWQREASRFAPGLKILEYVGQFRRKGEAVFDDYDIVLTTYGTMLRDIETLREYRFGLAILDESQAIKNALAQSAKAARLLNADHRLAMTGTPVENNTFELWSQFAFLNPGLLGSLDYFKQNFATPIESQGDEATAAILRRLVNPFILRRTKEQVAPELPPRTERIIYIDMEPAQKKIYTHTRDRYRAELLGLIETNGMNDARMKILEGLLRLRQACIHPILLEPTYRGPSAKFELLFETIDDLLAERHKALIFSQFVGALKLVRAELDQRKIPYAYLDGQTQDRQTQVDLFQENPKIPLFLLSLKAGGVGLNLTAADYILHIDPWWNPAVETQAADRAHRIGQDKPVFIYKFIARQSVEEKILELQERKKELVEQLISAEGGIFKSLTADDVRDLFS
jgi:non-specific serine/threonine protein kinase